VIVVQVVVVVAMIGLGHEQLDIFPGHLLGGISKNAFRSRVEGLDAALFVDGNDAVHDGIENCLEELF